MSGFTPEELSLIRASVGAAQRSASTSYQRSSDPKERAFVLEQLAKLEALATKLEAPLIADASQDAEDEE